MLHALDMFFFLNEHAGQCMLLLCRSILFLLLDGEVNILGCIGYCSRLRVLLFLTFEVFVSGVDWLHQPSICFQSVASTVEELSRYTSNFLDFEQNVELKILWVCDMIIHIEHVFFIFLKIDVFSKIFTIFAQARNTPMICEPPENQDHAWIRTQTSSQS